MDAPPVQYVKSSDGYDIAYCESGQGRPLVLLPSPFNHLGLMWQAPMYRRLFERLAERFHLVQYDSRGMGLSSRGLSERHTYWDLQTDLEAVVGRLRLDRFVLVASWYAHTAVPYAIKNPDRIEALVLGVCEIEDASSGVIPYEQVAKTSWEMMVTTMARTFLPGDPEENAKLLREGFTRADFLQGVRAGRGAVVSHLLPSLAVPTLVVGMRSSWLPLEDTAKRAASLIPDARLVMHEGLHMPFLSIEGQEPPLAGFIEDFVASLESRPAPKHATPASHAGLSQREIEVLRLIAMGKSNQEIADDLVISLNTVRRHVSNIFDKTGVANRAQATAFAKDHGIV